MMGLNSYVLVFAAALKTKASGRKILIGDSDKKVA